MPQVSTARRRGDFFTIRAGYDLLDERDPHLQSCAISIPTLPNTMGNKDHAAVSGKELPEQRILGAIFLMLVSPVFVIMIILAASSDESVPPSDGILSSLSTLYEEGVHNYIYRVWPNPFDPVVLRMLSFFSVFELVLQRFVPGKQVFASVTRTGWR